VFTARDIETCHVEVRAALQEEPLNFGLDRSLDKISKSTTIDTWKTHDTRRTFVTGGTAKAKTRPAMITRGKVTSFITASLLRLKKQQRGV
jgi:hypothetical protein